MAVPGHQLEGQDAAAVSTWQKLRRLDHDAASGRLSQRRGFRLLVWASAGLVTGALLGFFGTLWATITFSLFVGQYAVMIPIGAGLVGGLAGGLVGLVTALWRRDRRGALQRQRRPGEDPAGKEPRP